MKVTSPLIVALDTPNPDEALKIADQLDPALCRLKVGKELFTSAGPDVVRALMSKDFEVFLDLKFHDIPNTASKAVTVSAKLGVWMINVHATGGERMMRACRQSLDALYLKNPPLLIAVTVLTSMSEIDLKDTGCRQNIKNQVLMLAKLAKSCGMDGVVCSAEEASMLRSACGDDFLLVTPGIRITKDLADDQRRIVTPCQAISNGSDYLVIGRPITKAKEPTSVIKDILKDL